MARKQLLHDLLKENQEPFHLKSYIAEKRSQIQVKKRNPVTAMRKHACFLSFQTSPDVKKSPLMSPQSCIKSPNRSVFLHIPSRTAAILVEAAMRIHKQKSKPKKQSKSVGFGLFGSILKRLKDKSKKKNKAIGGKQKRVDDIADQAAASTSSNSDFGLGGETRFCTSPFRFSLHISPSSSGCQTPEFCSPAGSPTCHVAHAQQENVNYEIQNSNNVQVEDEEEKEQNSPVSVLDPPFEEDDGHGSGDEEEDDYDVECSYANVQRAKQQLLFRLRRFEELAEFDPMELERKFLDGSDNEEVEETNDYEDEELLSRSRFVTEVFNQSSLQDHTKKMSTDMKRLVSDLIVEEKSDTIRKEVVLGRICNRLDSWKEVEFNTIDMMVELDFKRQLDGWKKFPEQGAEIVTEIEVMIFGFLVEELSEELLCIDIHRQESNSAPKEST